MLDPLLNGAYWFDVAITIAVLGLAWPLFAKGGQPIPPAVRVALGVVLLFGLYIGIMALGHLVAVTIKIVLGTLPAGSNRGRLFRIGFMFAIPAWLVVVMTVRSVRRQSTHAIENARVGVQGDADGTWGACGKAN
jgi:hypothetical protein